ncbi:MAG: hypothetical protein ABMA64_31780 [Myxococcota bacterium]
MWFTWVVGCLGGPPVSKEIIDAHAPDLVSLGHPQAVYRGVKVASWSNGRAEDGERWVELDLAYLRPQQADENTLKVRVTQASADPCKVTIDVLFDDGPAPVLLDNGLASAALGADVCRSIEAEERSR